MSGIAGLLQFRYFREDIPLLVKRMTDELAHRGPAGDGFFVSDSKNQTLSFESENSTNNQVKLCLGQRFFQIENKYQNPLKYYQIDNGKYCVVFDGDIFNKLEIKGLLENNGYVFQSDSTAELILKSYKHWGIKCLDRFNGAWAMVIYDVEKKLLFASRDRVGVKPFYYFKDQSFFAFASEVKALLKLPIIEKKMNRAAVFDLFFQDKYEFRENFFEGISELPQSHYLLLNVEDGEIQVKRYFELSYFKGYEKIKEENFLDHVEKVKFLIEQAVKNQVDIQAPASLLSGGIDSSILTCTAKNLCGIQPKVFTACFEDKLFDEQQWAGIVVEQTGAEWFKTFPKLPDLIKDFEELAYCQDAPLTSAGTYAQFRAMKLAGQHGVKVIFDGQGADTLFAGQLPHQVALWRLMFSNGKFQALKKEMNAFGSFSDSSSILLKLLLKNSLFPRLPKTLKHTMKLRYFDELKYFNPDFVNEYKYRYGLYCDDIMKSLNHYMFNDYFGGNLKYLLKCVDRSSMWHSVRARTPFSDDLPLMEYAFQIPANYKIRNSKSKVLLREAFRGVVPHRIIERQDKMALSTPNNPWIMEMREHVFPYFEALDGSVFNKKKLLKDFHQFFHLDSPVENYRMFKYIGIAVWRKVFGV